MIDLQIIWLFYEQFLTCDIIFLYFSVHGKVDCNKAIILLTCVLKRGAPSIQQGYAPPDLRIGEAYKKLDQKNIFYFPKRAHPGQLEFKGTSDISVFD